MVNTTLRRSEVQAMTGLSVAGIEKMMRAGEFPEPIKVADRAVRWHRSEVEAWLANRTR